MPDEVRLIAKACPARLNDPEDICAGNVKEYRRRLLGYLTRSLSEGIESGEFAPVPLMEVAFDQRDKAFCNHFLKIISWIIYLPFLTIISFFISAASAFVTKEPVFKLTDFKASALKRLIPLFRRMSFKVFF